MELAGRRVLITGSAVRIGRGIAIAFAKEGASIYVHCHDSNEEATKLIAKLNLFSLGHQIICADLGNQQEISKYIFPQLPKTDILINNASRFNNSKILDESFTLAKKEFDINFWAPYCLMKRFMSQRKGKESSIINILDYRIEKPSLLDGSYLVSKAALGKLTELAALQWAPDMRVNAIAPGFVMPPKGMESSRMEKSLKKVPLMKAIPLSSIATACIFLSKMDSITGQTFFLDGGASL